MLLPYSTILLGMAGTAPCLAAEATAVSSSKPATKKPMNIAYYPDWAGLDPNKVDYSLFDILYYSFAMPASEYSLYWDEADSAEQLKKLVPIAHAAGTKVAISVGGWSGSQYFSDAVLPDNRKTFVDNMVKMVNEYGVDGLDLDWEYPSTEGAEGNIVRPEDSANLLETVKDLRQALGKDAIISAATPLNVWAGPDGNPMTDISAFVPYLDHVTVWGATNKPNAPLEDGCHDSELPEANAKGGVNAWHAAGMPLDKIILGTPAYGYVVNTTETHLEHRRNKRARNWHPMKHSSRGQRKHLAEAKVAFDVFSNHSISLHDHWHFPPFFPCPDTPGAGNLTEFMGDQVAFNQLIEKKAIGPGKFGTWVGRSGFVRQWDKCSSTPFLVQKVSSTVVAYDDPESLKIKAKYAVEAGIKGVASWSLDQDTEDYVLNRAVMQALGRAW